MTAAEMDLLVNQACGAALPRAELWFWRDGEWRDWSSRLLFPLRVERRLGAPATAEIALDNADGQLARDRVDSPANRNAAADYDPLLEEMRPVRLRQGVRGWGNLAAGRPYTATAADPTRPDGGRLTDGELADPAGAGWVGWQGAPVVTVTVDLGAVQTVQAVAVRCLSASASGVSLPTQAAVALSTAGAEGPFTAAGQMPLDHLVESRTGQAWLLSLPDVGLPARWVRLELTPAAGSWLCADEVAVYGGAAVDLLRTTFTGYLGDAIGQDAAWAGQIRLGQVRDTTKRLADAFVEVYARYQDQAIEAIIEDLLTNERYGVRCAPAEFDLAETGFTMPKWTSQNQSVLTSCLELARMIGWSFGADAAGVYRLAPLDYERHTPEHVFAGGDLVAWRKTASGLRLRNVVTVRSRDARNREIKATVQDGASAARYGSRLFALSEPAVRTAALARALALSILRDYGQVGNSGAAVVRGNLLLAPGQVVAVHEPDGTASGPSQLYRLQGLVSEQTGDGCGELVMDLSLGPYRANGPACPAGLAGTPGDGQVTLTWTPSADPHVAGYRVYEAAALAGPWQLAEEVEGPPWVRSGLENGVRRWFRVAALNLEAVEGAPAGPLGIVPAAGGGPAITLAAQWQLTGLAAEKVTTWAGSLPGLTWPHPALGLVDSALYNIYRATAAGGPWTLVASVTPDGDEQRWTDHTLRNPSGSYWWRVAYYDTESGWEAEASASVTLAF